jgi:hypothetical protein
MSAPTPARPRRRVSAQCAAGRHHLCHGTVYVYPPQDGKRFVRCQCRSPKCTHGRRDKR